jgi:hypothetical protein
MPDMTDFEKLALQRDILAAQGDEQKLAEIAERAGINPDLWRYFSEAMWQVREIEAEMEATSAID